MPKHHPSAAPLDTVLGPWLDRALEIGGGLQPALRALAASMPSGKRQEEWIEVCDIVAAKDKRLAAAGLAGHPENWIPLIAAAPPGATSGDGRSEVEFLSRAIDITTRDEPGRGWWRPAVYPLLVMATAIAISCLLAVMVVPTFKQIFNDFGMRTQGGGGLPLAVGRAMICEPNDLTAIGRTNDAILYGGHVVLEVSGDDASLAVVAERMISRASASYGQPFSRLFEQAGHDFYKLDPALFAPASVELFNLDTGTRHCAGGIAPEVLRESFGATSTVDHAASTGGSTTAPDRED